ncbi:aspartate racemase [Planococcus maritimus]|uniref:aspartate/glutamate racemase family protein n=1 Tax=Planococcus maritimus TaxID=192421 RepID=UPI00080F2B4F|nr:aspartate/glutamate racemase family protein [Planococcus maritimus]ANU18443.1 aspartate racemase [Planococcus maritimus]
MKTIGLIGGMSWESSTEYYRMLNEQVKQRLGGLHSAECLMYSVDFEEIERFQSQGKWDEAGERLANIARSLEKGGAELIVLCTNTMHKVISSIEEAVSVPVLHIADVTAKEIRANHLHTVGLLGTKYTMEQEFYKERIQGSGIEVLIPEAAERDIINEIIFNELCLGEINDSSKVKYRQVIQNLIDRGAQGIILGCTEIGLLIQDEDADVPLFDTAKIHVEAAVRQALDN